MLSCMQYIQPCTLGISRYMLSDLVDVDRSVLHSGINTDCSALMVR
jgi:hypothetical protein